MRRSERKLFVTTLLASCGALFSTQCGLFDGSPPHLQDGLAALEKDVLATHPFKLSDLHPSVLHAWEVRHKVAGAVTEDVVNTQLLQADAKAYPDAELLKLIKDHKPVPDRPDLSPRKRLQDEIRVAQCVSRTANPFVPVYTGAFSLALQGTFSETSQAQLAVPWGAQVQQNFTVSKQQGVTVPVTFVPAVNLANFYFGQVMAYFPNVSSLLAWPSPTPATPPALTPWPALTTSPPAPPAPIPTVGIAAMSLPPAPGSQMAEVQLVFDKIMAMRRTIETEAERVIGEGIPSDDTCSQLFLRGYSAPGFVPPAGLTVELKGRLVVPPATLQVR